MSQKITSKNLSYSSDLPPFLARLQAQTSGSGAASASDGPNPILSNQRRSGKKRSASEEAEDAPTVVDEQGNTVAVEIGRDGTVKAREPPAGEGDEEESRNEGKDGKKDGEVKSVVGGRRRKAGRVIGDAAEEGADGEESRTAGGSVAKTDEKPSAANRESKPKKKAKKIKLSFDEDE